MQPTKINILFVLPNFDKGGSERLVIDIIQNLDKNRYAPVLTVHFSGAYESEFKSSGIPFYVIHENGVLTKAQMYRKLSAIIRQHDIRIVNTHHTSALIQGFIPFKICNKTILIHTEHSKLENDKRIHPMARYVEKLLLKKVDVALGISRALGEYFEARLGVSQRKVQVIPNGIDIAKFDLKNVDRGACRAFLGIEESAPVVGLFGNFRAEKNHAVLVQAITALKKGMPNIQLILCGAGPEEPRLRSLADRLGLRENVKFLGIRSDVPELMQVLDVYCLPSIFEGMPLSLLEAMASGVPIVATNVDGIRELITDGHNGLLADSGSVESLAAKIQQLLENSELRQQMVANGRRFVQEYSIEKMIKGYDTLFSNLNDERQWCHG